VDTTIPPSTPINLSGVLSSDDTVASISWDASTDDREVAGYNVYRDNQYLTTIFETSHTLPFDADVITNFSIVAFDFDGNFSTRSDNLTLPELADESILLEPPSQPGQPTGSIEDTSVEISWNASTDNLGVAGYNVYQNNAYLTTVFTNQYSGTVNADAVYSYYTVAFDHNGNFSDPSLALRR